jgi:hypothetical protein
MRDSSDATRPSRRLGSRELALATHGLGWAAATVMLAATVVIAYAAPV